MSEQQKINPHAKWLREAAQYMRADGHVAWSNTCEQAADEIVRLTDSVPQKGLEE